MSGGLTETAMLAKLGLLDDDREPCNNDLGPTKPDPWDDYSSDDWQDPQWMECLDLIAKDPLLGVLLGAPHGVIFPDGTRRALCKDGKGHHDLWNAAVLAHGEAPDA